MRGREMRERLGQFESPRLHDLPILAIPREARITAPSGETSLACDSSDSMSHAVPRHAAPPIADSSFSHI